MQPSYQNKHNTGLQWMSIIHLYVAMGRWSHRLALTFSPLGRILDHWCYLTWPTPPKKREGVRCLCSNLMQWPKGPMKIVLDYNTEIPCSQQGSYSQTKEGRCYVANIEILRSDLRTMSHHFVHHTIKAWRLPTSHIIRQFIILGSQLLFWIPYQVITLPKGDEGHVIYLPGKGVENASMSAKQDGVISPCLVEANVGLEFDNSTLDGF